MLNQLPLKGWDMTRKYQQRHYEDFAAVLRDVSSRNDADGHTIALLVFQLGKMFEADSQDARPGYKFDAERFAQAVYSRKDIRS